MSDLDPTSGNVSREPQSGPPRQSTLEPLDVDHDDLLVAAEPVPAVPLLWPTFAVVISAIGAALVVSGLVVVVAGIATGGTDVFASPANFQQWIQGFLASRSGLVLMILPGQIIFFLAAIGAASLSSQGVIERLGLHRGRLPIWTWLFFLLGTPVIGILSSTILSKLATEPSPQLKMLEDLFSQHSTQSLFLLLALISLLPGFVEEILFRGYLQRRLLTRLPASLAIGISALLFAAAHMDPMHAVGVLPLGVWLGFIAWRAGSVWPAILGHIGNNGYAVIMSVVAGPNPDPERIGFPVAVLMGVCLIAFLASVTTLVARGPNTQVACLPVVPDYKEKPPVQS